MCLRVKIGNIYPENFAKFSQLEKWEYIFSTFCVSRVQVKKIARPSNADYIFNFLVSGSIGRRRPFFVQTDLVWGSKDEEEEKKRRKSKISVRERPGETKKQPVF